jgi:hypothetical protein
MKHDAWSVSQLDSLKVGASSEPLGSPEGDAAPRGRIDDVNDGSGRIDVSTANHGTARTNPSADSAND